MMNMDRFTDKELMQHFPLEVYYPLDASGYFLMINSEWNGNTIIMGKNVESIAKTFTYLSRKGKDEFKPVEFWSYKTVGPWDDLKVLYAEQKFKNLVKSFKWQIKGMIQEAGTQDTFTKIKKCPNSRKRNHDYSGCKLCEGVGYIFLDNDKDFYLKCVKYLMEDCSATSKYNTKPSRAQPPQPNSGTIYAVRGDFGDHNKGLYVDAGSDILENTDYYPYLFFFQGEKLELPSNFSAIIEKQKKQIEEENKHRRADFLARSKKRKQDTKEKLIKILG